MSVNIPYGTLRDIANELKNIREILEKQSSDTLQMDFPCNTCVNKGDHDGECKNCVVDSAPIKWETPTHYKPKQTNCGAKMRGAEGGWIDRDGWKFCSECDNRADKQANGVAIEPLCTNYCCECGAKMKGADTNCTE